jgi:hypothetical protein
MFRCKEDVINRGLENATQWDKSKSMPMLNEDHFMKTYGRLQICVNEFMSLAVYWGEINLMRRPIYTSVKPFETFIYEVVWTSEPVRILWRIAKFLFLKELRRFLDLILFISYTKFMDMCVIGQRSFVACNLSTHEITRYHNPQDRRHNSYSCQDKRYCVT